MQFAAALSRNENTSQAVKQIVEAIQRQLPGEIDLLTVFFTGEHQYHTENVVDRLRRSLAPRVLIGCGGEGVIGEDREVEGEPGITALAGRLPGVTLTPFHIGAYELAELLDQDCGDRLIRRMGLTDKDRTRAFLVLADPNTTAPDTLVEFMQGLESSAPGVPIVGGMASAGNQDGGSVLLIDDHTSYDGLVGVAIAGPICVDTVVSQGCRPIGETILVTRAEGNVIHTLRGKPALEVAREVISALEPEEQALVQNGLFVGIVIDEYRDGFQRGDFLVRNVLGYDPESGALAVGDNVRAGQTVQFHVRDARTADEDLSLLMAQATEAAAAPAGGLLFSCNGRGLRMFDAPHHDVRAVLEAAPETPMAGFFAMGEIGPVGGRSFLHGHTASIVLFRPHLEQL